LNKASIKNKNSTIKSYKKCIWYISHLDKCKMPSITDKNGYLDCRCKEKMDDLCIWINRFIKSVPKRPININEVKQIQYELFPKEDKQYDLIISDFALEKCYKQLFKKIK